MNDLKTDVLSFPITVSPDDQSLALLDFSFEGSLNIHIILWTIFLDFSIKES